MSRLKLLLYLSVTITLNAVQLRSVTGDDAVLVGCGILNLYFYRQGVEQGKSNNENKRAIDLATAICTQENLAIPDNVPICVRCRLIANPAECLAPCVLQLPPLCIDQ